MITYFKERLWLVFSIAAALCWGVWGVLAKSISSDISPYTNHMLFTVGMLFTIPLVARKCKPETINRKGMIWGLIAGILAVAGNLALYLSFGAGGLAAVVIPVTNLYPLVTIFIAVLVLKEKMHWLNGIGILVVVPAVTMLSGQSQIFDDPSLFFTNLGLNAWMMYALAALVFWGLFSAAQKVTTNYISAEWSYISFILASAAIAIVFVVMGKVDFNFTKQTLFYGTLAGALNGLGVLASFAAYRSMGKAAQVTAIAGALQPVFTIALAMLFLGEQLKGLEFVGIALAIVGAMFLSVEKKKDTSV